MVILKLFTCVKEVKQKKKITYSEQIMCLATAYTVEQIPQQPLTPLGYSRWPALLVKTW